MKRPALWMCVLLFCAGIFSAAEAKSETKHSRVSLDLLVRRVEEYWMVLSKGNRIRAGSYISASDREEFLKGTNPPFRTPRFKSLELSEDWTEATVTVTVKRIVPPVTVEMDWPVIEHWRFEKGNWYRRYDPKFMPLLGLTRPRAMSPERMESLRSEIRSRLRFEKTTFDFGSVNQGTDAVLAVKYTLTGPDSIPVALRSSAPGSDCPECTRERGIAIRGTREQELSPGEQQELTIEIPTWNYAGAVKEQFTLVAKFETVDVPFHFSVRGEVYVPISISPKVLRFRKGEREKVISVRNNSKSDIELQKYISESRAITIEPFPATVLAGEQIEMSVKAGEFIDSVIPNTVDRVAITYTPVDGFSGLSYRVFLNFVEEKQQKASPAANKIREMIERNRIVLPSR